MLDPESGRDPVEVLATEFVDRHRREQHPTIDEYVERYPEWADRIRNLFPTIVAMEGLKMRQVRSSRDGQACLGAAKLERFGDFRILAEVGRGGMGIVYEAEQLSLGRHVAVKVLPKQSLLDPKHLRRFEREAQTAARLHHTNIVPVFGFGEQDGFHYIVMQYIRGVGLDRVLAELRRLAPAGHESAPAGGNATDSVAPSLGQAERSARSLLAGHYWRSVAKIGVQVAEALEYAHAQGTLHRDIKPANLLLDVQNVVWIADFGLAKAMRHDDVSRTDDIIGTLRYMAPERFQGQADARSDIYSLGLTLYELLALKPAFDCSDRSNLIKQIIHGAMPTLWKVGPAIPKDLKTIVLKAIARERKHRYQTAGDLAADLRCCLEDRPITARPTGAAERVWRWCRRNRAIAALSAAALTLLVLVAVVATAGYVRTTKALRGETEERRKAVATSHLATEVLDRIYEQFTPSRLGATTELTVEDAEGEEYEVPIQPVLSDEVAVLLENMLVFYDRLAEQGIDQAKFRQKAAEANRRVGDIRQRLGQFEQAETAYRRALEIYEVLDASSSDQAHLQTEMARAHNELGNVYVRTQQPQQANQAYTEALEILQSTPVTLQEQPEVRFEVARTYYYLGRSLLWPRRGPPGRPRGRRSEADPRSTASADDGPAVHDAPRQAPPPLGASDMPPDATPERRRPRGPGRTPPGTDYLEKAVHILEQLATDHPSVPDYRHLLAQCHSTLSLPRSFHDRQRAADTMKKATDILEALVRDFPDVPDYRYDLSQTYAMQGAGWPARSVTGDAETETRMRNALAISEQLVAEHPNVPDYAASQSQIHYRFGEVLERSDRNEDAQASYQKAVHLQDALVERFPKNLSYTFQLSRSKESLARVLQKQGRLDAARTSLEESIAALTSLRATNPNGPIVDFQLARSYRALSDILSEAGQKEASADATRRAEEHRSQLRSERRRSPRDRQERRARPDTERRAGPPWPGSDRPNDGERLEPANTDPFISAECPQSP